MFKQYLRKQIHLGYLARNITKVKTSVCTTDIFILISTKRIT